MEINNDCNCNGAPKETAKAKLNQCPVCDTEGVAVSKVTVEHLVIPADETKVDGADYFLCMNTDCNVAYFNPLTKTRFMKDQLIVPIWFKKNANPKYACYCSKVTEDQVVEAVVIHGAKTVKEVNAITGAMKDSNCKENNPLGVCCHQIIQGVIDQALLLK